MSTTDVLTLFVFMVSVLAGLAFLVLGDALRQRAGHRIRARLRASVGVSRNLARQKILADLERAQSEARRRRRRQAMGSLGYYLNRLDTVGQGKGSRNVLLAMGAAAMLALLGLMLGILPLSWWSWPLALGGVPLLAGWLAYHKMLERFEHGFLGQLPDAMDMIVRASQAGVPVNQSIRNIGEHFSAPLGPEFRKVGDSLLLGNDLQEVLDEAVLRIELPDFSFFSVCLSLQRDTGGSLVEALENLAGVIRARRDLRLKAKAMTAEGRLSGMILAALPFVIGATLFASSPDYIRILFETDTGHSLLGVAGVMLTIGVLSIRKLAKLEV
ncbi:pilus assembly protein [Alcaligenaceae bacterium SJ-26]|nr:pilus assembly protein [Alcaligenaceae bacterium SJ-26]